ncbi:MAG: phosphoglycerate kinase, partial [bacterium]
MKLKTITSAGVLRGEKVLLRTDLNEPIRKSQDEICSKLSRALPTIRFLLERGSRVILMTHRGRPEGKVAPAFSNRALLTPLTELLKTKVKFATDVVGESAKKESQRLKNGEVLLLENLRFEKGEEKNSPKFSKALAELGTVYVNDGFAVSHRAHASTVGVTKFLPSFAGIEMVREVPSLLRVLGVTPRSVVVGGGGARIAAGR